MFRCGFVLVCVGLVIGECGGSRCVGAGPVVLESAGMGSPGRIGGTSITTAQFIGWRFETDQMLAVRRVGGHLLSFPDEPGDIFAALVKLDSVTSVPHGAPFNSEEVVASTTFRPPFPSAESFTPLTATLTPGSYVMVLGTGMFGATGAGAAHNGDDQPDIPPTNLSSFIYWSRPFAGEPFEWRKNLASHIRFVIEAESIDLVGDYNGNGEVDAADYVVWRDREGTSDVLANDLIGGQIGAAQYEQWRAHFGETSVGGTPGAAGATLGGAVPEPGTLATLIGGILIGLFQIRRIVGRRLPS